MLHRAAEKGHIGLRATRTRRLRSWADAGTRYDERMTEAPHGELNDLRRRADDLRLPYAEQATMPSVVYHYCDLDAAIHILQECSVRASNIAHSNDPTEVAYGQRILQSVVKSDFPIFSFRDIFAIVADIDFYASCFSGNGDLLPQWRAYCSNGKGVALGVHTSVLLGHKEMLFVRMEYDEDKQRQLARETIKVYEQPLIDAYPNEAKVATLAHELALQFVVLKGMFKSPAYESEREYRLFNTLPKPVAAHDFKLKFRAAGAAGSVLVPYYDVSVASSRDERAGRPFAEIILGPCMPLRTSRDGLKLLLGSSKLGDVPICRSRVRMNCS